MGWGVSPIPPRRLSRRAVPQTRGLDHGSIVKPDNYFFAVLAAATQKTARHIAGLSEDQPLRPMSQVEMRGLEPLTSALQRRRSPN